MAFVEIGNQKVRMVFTPTGEPDTFILNQDCGLGCRCESRVSRFAPNIENAAWQILCFNDTKRRGLSGKGCSGKAISEGPDLWVYEIDAKLKELQPDPPVNDPFPKTKSAPPPMPPCKAPGPKAAATPSQLIADGICADFEKLSEEMQFKAREARDIARKARRKGNTQKWDKYNAVARVYEMNRQRMFSLYDSLINLTSDQFRDDAIPF